MWSSGSRRSMLAWVLTTSLVSLSGAAGSAHATVYKWVDSSGIAHYTTDPAEVPAGLRGQIPSARSSEVPDIDRVPPPQGPAGRNLLSAIPAPRLSRRGDPGNTFIPAPRRRDAPSEIDAASALLRDIPPARQLARASFDLGAIPPPRHRRDAARGIAEPPPFAPEARLPEEPPPGKFAPAGRSNDSRTPSPETEAGPAIKSPAPETGAGRARALDPDAQGAPGIGAVDSSPPFDSLFDDPPKRESPEILDLERRIQADRDALKKMLTIARSSETPLSDDAELRAISQRLPILQARLAALRAQRER